MPGFLGFVVGQVAEVVPGSSANMCGAIEHGDTLIAIDGESCVSWDHIIVRKKTLCRSDLNCPLSILRTP